MGSTLTGSTVSSTYNSLLKTTDNSALNASLKSVSDGLGNDSALQISTTDVNVAGGLSVNTNKLTVAAASGNTVVAGTLQVAGNVSVNTNKFTVAAATGNTAIDGTLVVNGNTQVGSNLTVSGSASIIEGVTVTRGITQSSPSYSNSIAGPTTFTGNVTFGQSLTLNANVTFNLNQTTSGTATFNGSTVMNGNTTVGNDVSDTATVNATSTFSGPATFNGPATLNGNVTIGNEATDTLTINSAFNPATVTAEATDFILIQDVSDSNKIKKASIQSASKSLDWDLIGDALVLIGGGPKLINTNPSPGNVARGCFPGWSDYSFSIAECDFIPSKITITVLRSETHSISGEQIWFKVQYNTSPNLTDLGWVDSGLQLRIDGNNAQYLSDSSNFTIGSTPSKLYFRIKVLNTGTSGSGIYINTLRVRFQNY